ncbi:hypothetical protein M406DRAFT_356007 [Cryphonectria parasitica EP155]|uniref:T6SS Phospholipase effector Tle1-like catalytic domain-containing protein n=1 Tax=Cryphonectria parasitica (strain ATCC 38755 / EP155) TaxID=660469 RepID=A0A9P4Y3V8_CRYP1|nr:uncharacterized protein M406DRAFT_356007 [Cryphonectria parasitica EP155]KAF3765660.1 hypothetical protein M406DRAFT_356007 [Cryphonectria parasitica EP155]
MDEPRSSFRPALWERLEGNTTTYLKQVWFPGTHANIGGGWYDQQIASITLAWICDQLTPLGVEFNPHSLTRLFYSSLRYSAAHPYPSIPSPSIFIPSFIWSIILRYRIPIPWAFTPKPCPPPKSTQRIDQANCTDDDHHPHGSPEQLWKFHGRPWGLGQTRFPTSWFQLAGGTVVRRPGCYMRVDPDNNKDTTEPLLNTNERVHSCVRLRLRLGGMSPDDRQTWPCASLLEDDSHGEKPVWRLERGKTISQRELDQDTAFWDSELADDKKDYDSREIYNMQDGDGDWNWVFEDDAVIKNSTGETVRPLTKVLPEEPLVGYWERCLLALTRGELDDWRLGEEGVPGTVNGGKFV